MAVSCHPLHLPRVPIPPRLLVIGGLCEIVRCVHVYFEFGGLGVAYFEVGVEVPILIELVMTPERLLMELEVAIDIVGLRGQVVLGVFREVAPLRAQRLLLIPLAPQLTLRHNEVLFARHFYPLYRLICHCD